MSCQGKGDKESARERKREMERKRERERRAKEAMERVGGDERRVRREAGEREGRC